MSVSFASKTYPTHPKGAPSPLVLQTNENPQLSIIWLHGLGDTSENFSNFCKNLPIYKTHPLRFIIPQAPICSVAYRFDMNMPSWYNVSSIEIDNIERNIDLKDIHESRDYVLSLIQEELKNGIPYNKIFLGGFSQGGAISLETAFSLPQKIGGIICLSGYLPHDPLREVDKTIEKSCIFFAYGLNESLLPIKSFSRSCSVLQQHGFTISEYSYNMDHEICMQEIFDINDFIIKKIQI